MMALTSPAGNGWAFPPAPFPGKGETASSLRSKWRYAHA